MTTRLIDSELSAGERIDRYDLVAEIASGGMATVYLARLGGVGGFQRTVALKRLHPHLAKNAEFVQMFFDEARLAALIHHPNVVPILEVGEGAQGYYLVMEYIEGDTLASLLSNTAAKGQRIPLSISLKIIVDMLQGLHAAHELKDDHGQVVGLVHRDVSPQNILVGTDGITRITDFGVARAASRLSGTRAGQLKGKLAYMAPEQANGEEDLDRRADVFAAGVVLWEALAFKRLFKAENHVATLQRVLSERIVSPRRLNPEVPETIAAICLKALQRDPDERFASCAEFAEALERAALAAEVLASTRAVSQHVEQVVGEDVESHRKAIREWTARKDRPSSAVSQRSAPPPLRLSRMTPPPPETSSVITQTGAGYVPPPPPSSSVSSLVPPPPPLRSAAPPVPPTLVSQAPPPLQSSPVLRPYSPPGNELTGSEVFGRPARSKTPLIIGAALLLVVVGLAFFLGRSSESPAASGPQASAARSAPKAAPAAPTEVPLASAAAPAPAAVDSAADELEDLPMAEPEPVAPQHKRRVRRSTRATRKPTPKKKSHPNVDLSNPYQ